MKISLYESPSSRRLPSRSRSARLGRASPLSALAAAAAVVAATGDAASILDTCGAPRAHRTTTPGAADGGDSRLPWWRSGARPHCGCVGQRSMGAGFEEARWPAAADSGSFSLFFSISNCTHSRVGATGSRGTAQVNMKRAPGTVAGARGDTNEDGLDDVLA